jgi:hypothetical protein
MLEERPVTDSGISGNSRIRQEANRLIAYHSDISKAMTAERTSLESGLIPVSAYILVACCEAYFRYPAMIPAIEAAMPAEKIGAAGRRPGLQVNPVYLWSVANFFLVGRKFLTLFQLVDDQPEPAHAVLDFWERAALAYRGDGHRQAWDGGFATRTYAPETVTALADAAAPVAGDDERARLKRFNATVTAYLFLLYFDTRVGTSDTGPYDLGDGRVLLVRDWYRLSQSDFWWSDVAASVPYHNLTAGLVLEGVDVKVNDWGTSITTPEDYLDHLVGFSLFTTDNGDLEPVDLAELDAITAEVRTAQAQHYRNIAAMSRAEKIRCGAYVYFTFLRPFAEVAGVADDLDWTVPLETKARGLYDLLEPIEGGNTPPDPSETYYLPFPEAGA